MKKWNEQLLKITLTNDKLKAEIKLSDLVWLFENSPSNYDESSDGAYATLKRGNRQKFAEWIVDQLLDDSPGERDGFVWSEPFEYAFEQLAESGEEFLNYKDDE